MIITDLTEAYRIHCLGANDPRRYEAERPELFAHYHAHWGVPDRPYVSITTAELIEWRGLILDRLPELERRFAESGLDVSPLELILMVGQGTSNGHGMLTPNGAAVWLAVEAYTSRGLADVFVAHEIAHALHYLCTPAFYFHSRAEKKAPVRQLITEGLATYVTRRVLDCDWGTALWADYLEPEAMQQWLHDCQERLPELAADLIRVHDDGEQTEMFYANDPTDVLKFRAGYYLGLTVIESLITEAGVDMPRLLAWPREDFEHRAKELLQRPGDLTTP